MIPDSLSPLVNHLWQSTLFALAAWLLALTLRRNSARVRHGVWVAASVKFLLPFSLLVAMGSRVEWRTVPAIAPQVSVAVEQVSRPFTIATLPAAAVPQPARSALPGFLLAMWACGFLGLSVAWFTRWLRIRRAVRAGSPVELGLPVPAVASLSFLEPAVFGAFRPVLLLPEGI